LPQNPATDTKEKQAKEREYRRQTDIYVRFVDVLFAVVVGQSFGLLTSSPTYRACIMEPAKNAETIAGLILIYLLVMSSWYYFNRCPRRFPIRSPIRFGIDVALLFLYYLGFLAAPHLTEIMAILFDVFVGYLLWEFVRFLEYYREKNRQFFEWKIATTLGFTLISLVLPLLFDLMMRVIAGIQWLYFAILIIFVLGYRWAKLKVPRYFAPDSSVL